MTDPRIRGWRPPSPRAPLDDQLEQERAVAAAVTRHDRRELDALGGALDAIARCEATT